MVSLLERADALPEGDNFAGAVGHRNATVVGLDPPGDDGKVMEIQRTRKHPHQYLPGTRDGFGTAFDDELVEPARGFDGSDLHGMPFSDPSGL